MTVICGNVGECDTVVIINVVTQSTLTKLIDSCWVLLVAYTTQPVQATGADRNTYP